MLSPLQTASPSPLGEGTFIPTLLFDNSIYSIQVQILASLKAPAPGLGRPAGGGATTLANGKVSDNRRLQTRQHSGQAAILRETTVLPHGLPKTWGEPCGVRLLWRSGGTGGAMTRRYTRPE